MISGLLSFFASFVSTWLFWMLGWDDCRCLSLLPFVFHGPSGWNDSALSCFVSFVYHGSKLATKAFTVHCKKKHHSAAAVWVDVGVIFWSILWPFLFASTTADPIGPSKDGTSDCLQCATKRGLSFKATCECKLWLVRFEQVFSAWAWQCLSLTRQAAKVLVGGKYGRLHFLLSQPKGQKENYLWQGFACKCRNPKTDSWMLKLQVLAMRSDAVVHFASQVLRLLRKQLCSKPQSWVKS